MSYQGNTGCSCGGGGASGGGSGGGTTVVCSRPSIPVAVPGLCLADGTPIATISTRAMDGTWVRTGWLNLATGGFTAGRPPASAKPCNPNDNGGGGEPATLAGVHVEDWCDVDADGNVLSPVLAKYETDDTGAIVGVEFLTPDGEPYEVQGTLGICNTDGPADLTSRELVRLCDVADDGTSTVFVRDYERDSSGAVVGFTDYDIAGQPYTPSGEVTSCDTAQPEDECASPTTPLATTGLCLADGTPIATVATRDCDGVVSTDGWINLLTNTYTAGQPPAGARACGETSAFDVSGVLCDVNADGDVLGLVLIEVERGTDGEITGTRLINAADGSVYELQGELTVCPAGVDQPERDLIELCDLTDDGEGSTATRFLRDYARDENGAIVGYTDYTLDGQPYTPVGEIGACEEALDAPTREHDLVRLCDTIDAGEDVETVEFIRDYERDTNGSIVGHSDYTLDGLPYEPQGDVASCDTQDACQHCETLVLCDITPGEGDTPDPVFEAIPLAELPDGPTDGVTESGVSWSVSCGQWISPQNHYTIYPVGGSGSPACVQRWEFDRPVFVRFGLRGLNVNPRECIEYRADADVVVEYLHPDHRQGENPPTSICGVGSATAESILVTAEPVTWLELEAITNAGQGRGPGLVEVAIPQDAPPGAEAAHAFLRRYCRDCDGETVSVTDTELDGTTPYEPQGVVGTCGAEQEPCEQSTSLLRLCDLNPDTPPDSDGKICAQPFLRHLVHDCDGNVVSHHDTEPDGTTPYTPVQVVDCTTHTPALVEVPWVTVSVEEDPAGPERQAFIFRISPEDDPDTVGVVRVQTSRQAGGACGDYDLDRLLFSNTADYTITLDEVAQSVSSFKVNLIDFDWFEPVQITGPMPTRLGGTAVWNDAGNRIVPTEDNGTGEMYWDAPPPEIAYTIWNTGGGNSCSQLSFEAITFKPEGCCTCDTTNGGEPTPEVDAAPVVLCDTIDGGEGEQVVPFLRSYQIDNGSGTITGHTDTELDGSTPYEPVGTVGVCSPTGDEQEPQDRYEVEVVPLCVLDTDGEVVRQVLVEHVYDTATGERTETRNVDPVTGEPVELAEGETIGQCVEPCRDTQTMLLCDLADDGEVTASTTDVTPPPYSGSLVPLPGGGGALWSGGTLQFPADPDASAGDGSQIYRNVAGQITAAPECGDTGRITVSVRVRNDGPGDGLGTSGGLRLYRGDTIIAQSGVPMGAPAGYVGTLTASAGVTADDLTSGALVAVVWLETFHGTAKSWTVDQYETVLDWEKCPTQFLRNVVVDCETGEVLSTRDTTLDGQPYEVTGEVEQCQPANSGADPLPEFDVAPIVLCDTIDGGEDVETVEFLRAYQVDNSTGIITGFTDTDLDGATPYVPQGVVGQCRDSSDVPAPEPEPRVDVETELLCVLDADGAKIREVRVERVYDDQAGVLTEQRIIDPTSDEPYTLADGETLGSCPECPVAFATECVAVVDRSTVSYDNTAMIGGVPGQCGSVQGPVDSTTGSGAQFGCQGGPYRITSWIIDGTEVVTGTPPTFAGGPCGTGTTDNPGMHTNWATVLTNLDPHGAWEVDTQPGCAWFVRSDAPRPVEYGPMIIEGDGVVVQDGVWTLGPAQDCEETPYTKVYSQDCDGEITVSWLDAQGNPTDAPEGELVPCGTGCRSSSGGGCCDEPSQDIRCETFVLCDTGLDGDDPVSFMRAVCRDSTGAVVSVTDTELDAITPYTVRS